MKSIDFLTTEERVYSALPFSNMGEPTDRMHFVQELRGDYTEDELDDIDALVKRSCCETMIRLLQFLLDAKTDKQVVARLICIQKLLSNAHGNWKKFAEQHDITVKTVRAEREKLKRRGLKIK